MWLIKTFSTLDEDVSKFVVWFGEKCVFLPTITQCFEANFFQSDQRANWQFWAKCFVFGANRDVLFLKKIIRNEFKNRQIRSVFIHSFNIWEILCVFYCAVAHLLQGLFFLIIHYNGNLCVFVWMIKRNIYIVIHLKCQSMFKRYCHSHTNL